MRVKDGIFPHANTIICIEDSKLLKRFQYEILYNTGSLQAALDELNKTNYFRTYESADTKNYSIIIDRLMKDTFDLLRDIAPTELIWKIFALYYDIHNMKLVVKERLSGKRLDDLALSYGSYSLRTIRSAAVRESDDILKNETLTRGFFEALSLKDMYDVDFVLDKTYFRTLKGIATSMGVPEIVGFVIEKIDLFNLSVFFQSRAAGTPRGYFTKAFSDQGTAPIEEWYHYVSAYSNAEMSEAEKFPLWQKYKPIWEPAENRRQLFEQLDVLIDNYLIEKTKACKLIAFGISPICAYFFNKFMESKNIRILLTGKESSYSTGEIRVRMRIPYEL